MLNFKLSNINLLKTIEDRLNFGKTAKDKAIL